MDYKKHSNFLIIFVNIHAVFIVLCLSKYSEENKVNLRFNENNSSTLEHSRERREIRRGQNYYFQRGYDINRLQFENHNKYSEPRSKPLFHRVNEVYSYYLPPDFKKFDSYENFDDRNRRYGTKSKPKSGSYVSVNTLNKRILPTTLYQSRMKHKDYGVRDTLSRDQQNHRPQYRQHYQSNRREQDFSPTPYYSSYSISSSSASSSSTSRLVRQTQNLQNIPRNSTFSGIPGWIYRDFPGYSQVPDTGFRCDRQPYYGYFADVNAGCQVFHVCQLDGRRYSFLCPNSTLFHQKVQTCDWWFHVDCNSSPQFYYLNARIGVLPPQPATLDRFDN